MYAEAGEPPCPLHALVRRSQLIHIFVSASPCTASYHSRSLRRDLSRHEHEHEPLPAEEITPPSWLISVSVLATTRTDPHLPVSTSSAEPDRNGCDEMIQRAHRGPGYRSVSDSFVPLAYNIPNRPWSRRSGGAADAGLAPLMLGLCLNSRQTRFSPRERKNFFWVLVPANFFRRGESPYHHGILTSEQSPYPAEHVLLLASTNYGAWPVHRGDWLVKIRLRRIFFIRVFLYFSYFIFILSEFPLVWVATHTTRTLFMAAPLHDLRSYLMNRSLPRCHTG
ncbi:hypothetical protein BDQ94DRAFT_177217 [Aspergillus welwitschiae]|uniref:Uncharacterized protein n=1 Tax=Aspergillus welwitschiae TaxID=1341132 RepID=A0A3F3Q7B8_9EURO|nr:hypothetical protein BDQ94DRAFT_177217 [Aspergillus welwitschiae]RDH35081.1 hypothetical protein BDQ94DRAFT_177217 [Aspergillus welwitschiae]